MIFYVYVSAYSPYKVHHITIFSQLFFRSSLVGTQPEGPKNGRFVAPQEDFLKSGKWAEMILKRLYGHSALGV